VNTLKGLSKRQQITESYCVSSESENATSLQLTTNIEFLLYTIYNFLLHCQKQVYYLQVTSDGMLRITVSLLIVDTMQLKVQFTKNDKCVWINLDFTFLKCTFSLILHTTGPTRTFTKMIDFFFNTSVLRTQFFDCVFQLGSNWYIAAT